MEEKCFCHISDKNGNEYAVKDSVARTAIDELARTATETISKFDADISKLNDEQKQHHEYILSMAYALDDTKSVVNALGDENTAVKKRVTALEDSVKNFTEHHFTTLDWDVAVGEDVETEYPDLFIPGNVIDVTLNFRLTGILQNDGANGYYQKSITASVPKAFGIKNNNYYQTFGESISYTDYIKVRFNVYMKTDINGVYVRVKVHTNNTKDNYINLSNMRLCSVSYHTV